MEIVLWVYGISIAVLIIVYIISLFQKKNGAEMSNEKWWVYLLILLFSPLVVLFVPYILIQDAVKNKGQKEQQKKREVAKKQKQNHQEAALKAIESAKDRFSILPIDQIELADKLIADINRKNYNFIDTLGKLRLPQDMSIEVELGKEEGIGSSSRLFVSGRGCHSYEIFKFVYADASEAGAWQAYLLNSLWHALPYFWHGGYDYRSYIFSQDSIAEVSCFQEEDEPKIKQVIARYDVTPRAFHCGDKYYISCCYWNDWAGLVRELVEVTIQNNEVTEFFEVKSDVLFKYDCQICF